MRSLHLPFLLVAIAFLLAPWARANEVEEALAGLNRAITERNEAAVATAFASDAKIEVFWITEHGPGTKTMTVKEYAKYIVAAWPDAATIERTSKIVEQKPLPAGEVGLKVETTEKVTHGKGLKGTATNVWPEALVLAVKDKTAKIRSYSQSPPK
jgi:hypothetical protein